jgi:regulatory protein YycI of two-component signal transduction system YycFG
MLDKKRIFLITIILLEIFVVFYLLNNLFSKKYVPVITDIPKESIVFENIRNSSFKYFYENSPICFI